MNPLRIFPGIGRRLPDYNISTRNVYLRQELNHSGNVCIFDKRGFFCTYGNLFVYCLWMRHCTSFYTNGAICQCLGFPDGRKMLFDAGVSAEMFSVILNRTTDGAGQLLSVEPDVKRFRLFQERIRLRNGARNRHGVNCALSDKEGCLIFSRRTSAATLKPSVLRSRISIKEANSLPRRRKPIRYGSKPWNHCVRAKISSRPF